MATQIVCDGCGRVVKAADQFVECSVLLAQGRPPEALGSDLRHYHLKCWPLDPPEATQNP